MITLHQYVKRLEKMLEQPKPCTTCPGIKGFRHYTEPNCRYLSSWMDSEGYLDERICVMCEEFVGIIAAPSILRRCPCFYFKYPKVAIKRARKAIKEYYGRI